MEDQAAALTVDDLHSRQVDRTLKELQRMVKEHELALDKLRASPPPSFPEASQLAKAKASVDAVASAYRAVAESPPLLPSHGSVLPALLALRKTHLTIAESSVYATSQSVSLDKSKRQLEHEKANLEDEKALQAALERRIETLRHGLETTESKTAEEIARERLEELRQEKQDYDRETSKLLKSFNKFINDHLGTMLAAEELGGPVVGDLMEIDTDELGAGFNAQGKLRKTKATPDEDVRQRRIDDIWGAGDGQEPRKGKKRERDESDAAGAELRDLSERLLNSLMESAGDNSASYVKIPRETAASRFLVRSKVAQFHPKDATMLRLVDFGRELDD
ncbi:hypothetical protein CONLIGDRAFT_53733 [Coniochaeta ligniaria NRRL 30616]|uniref:Centromere protein Cenp-K n=1 Tax=Coniochaeta ligniaria NRRL 30616 TaxID=1408157 RepID=A0A1J7J5A9_9PEZI|nr:hypothetical protein CONLIGDRAFT_53733 [Coniochaeta ligniaria NRRL 30616]